MYIQTVDNGVRGMDGGGRRHARHVESPKGEMEFVSGSVGGQVGTPFFCGSDLHTRKNIHSYAAHPGHISRCARAKLRRCPRRRTQSTAHTPGSLAHGGASAGGLSPHQIMSGSSPRRPHPGDPPTSGSPLKTYPPGGPRRALGS